eukprot:6467989-Amphidinium_carterae.1
MSGWGSVAAVAMPAQIAERDEATTDLPVPVQETGMVDESLVERCGAEVDTDIEDDQVYIAPAEESDIVELAEGVPPANAAEAPVTEQPQAQAQAQAATRSHASTIVS